MTAAAVQRPSGHSGAKIPSLDGIRTFSVTLVFLSHGGFGDIIPGGMGVTVFFVLSGFLITTLMRAEYAKQGSVDFPAFYLRRFFRLMPPLLFALCLSLLASSVLSVGGPFTWTGLLSVLFYFSNYFRILSGDIGQPPGLGVTWSLAVEEHYYLLFPPLALVLLRMRSRRHAALLLGGLCTLILLWRCWLRVNGAPEAYLEEATDTRVDAILVGCLMAMVFNPWLEPVRPPNKARDLAITAGCVALLGATLLWRNPDFRTTFRYTAQSLIIAVLMYQAVARSQTLPFRWLNWAPIAYLGTISYTIYLVHFVVLMTVQKYAADLGPSGVLALAAVVTVIIAAFAREAIEKPAARLQQRLRQRLFARRSVNAAVARAS